MGVRTAAFHGEQLWTMVKCAHNARGFLPAPRDLLFCIPERTVHVVSKGTCSFQLSVFNDEYMFLVLMLFEDKLDKTHFFQFFIFSYFPNLSSVFFSFFCGLVLFLLCVLL